MRARGAPGPEQEPAPPSAVGTAVAPAAPAPASRLRRRPELDGQRGVAVLGALVFHVYQFCDVGRGVYRGTPAAKLLTGLEATVPWLFVLAAFLLFAPFARAIVDGGPRPAARGFVLRRVVRVLPAYYVAVLIVWFSRQTTLPGDWRDLLEHLTFTQVLDERRIFYTIGPAWAISVAAACALGVGLVVAAVAPACLRLRSRRRRVAALAGVTAALAAVSVAWKTWAFSSGRLPAGSFTTWFGPPAFLDVVAVGLAVATAAAALGDARPLGPRRRLGLRVAAVAGLALAVAAREPGRWTEAWYPSACAVAFGCLVAAAALGPPPDRRAAPAARRLLRWGSAVSFGVYLWHEPILLGLDGLVRQEPGAFVPDVVVVLLASLLAGAASRALVERPARRLGRAFGRDGRLLLRGRRDTDRLVWDASRTG